ncbi:hypothetical protein KM043_017041 [Ampulex compressa]|nr:hypothetical protein KM043_017041 [Ampulex compressa]
MKVHELKDKLEEMGIDTKGLKKELVAQLTTAMKRKECGKDSDVDDSDYDDDEVRRQPRQMLSFKDVEDSIQRLNGDNVLTLRCWLATSTKELIEKYLLYEAMKRSA